MANWYGTARSNYVRVKNMEGLTKALAPFDIKIEAGQESTAGRVMFTPSEDSDYGGWPSWGQAEDGGDVEFDPTVHICPFLRKGEVLVMMEAGAEKLRYVTGSAQAYAWDGRCAFVDISQIYALAAKKFKVPVAKITAAEY